MARRRKTSPFEDLIDLASMLPWWAAVCLALVSYILLHNHAISPPPVAHDPKQMSDAMVGIVTRGLAMGGQYLLPLAFILGAIGSVAGRARRKKLVKDVAVATKPGRTVDGISWREFEMLVGEVFRKKGFMVSELGGNGPDGGVDLILRKDGEKYLVQCKHWRSMKVGVTVVREFFGVMAAQGAVGGFIVTSGTYTSEAQNFAAGRNIQLIAGEQLNIWIRSAAGSKPFLSEPVTPVSTAVNSPQQCPICRSPMVIRTAKRGTNVGRNFWGCSKYPSCRGVVEVHSN